LSFDLKKPQKYENRKLGSEKTEEKKFTLFRRFTQNGITKFNWNFNAAKKLSEVIARAKASHKDDYTHLLSFYNFSLDVTKKEKIELDSVIYKANAGILIHDLRNSWIDNLYMLMGEAYYFKKELDSAYFSFQYINYAFAPKEKDGYDKPIGSNANADEGGNVFSISTRENTSLPKRIWARPPSRNESFIWQIRTFLAKDELPEAAGLIETLKHDPLFPQRLQSDLHEMQALWFYKQQIYDSAAIYLEQALDNAENREEKARWEYLIGQLYERAGKPDMASEFFDRSVNHTLNPVMEVYARLNSIRQHKGDDKVIQENVKLLVKMAHKDRYVAYRDIIYYAAAEMELERNNVAGAKGLLLKAAANPGDDPSVRSRAFLMLGNLSFKEKNYYDAKRYYDSITNLPPDLVDPVQFSSLKSTLAKIVGFQASMHRQDSLQRIAAMPEEERQAYIKKLVKQLRKQQGLKEENDGSGSGGPLQFNDPNAQPTSLFDNNAKGDWYFYNNALKSKGYTEFKANWGNRPNVDNWQRQSAIKQNTQLAANNNNGMDPTGKTAANGGPAGPVSYDELLKQVPLTPAQMAASNDSIEHAQFGLGKTYLDGLEDYQSTIDTLESFLSRFPTSKKRPEALFMLAYCYSKTGNTAKAQAAQDELKQKYAGTSFEKIVSSPNGVTPDSAAKLDMTRRYDNIYNAFIEGNFEEALAQKHIADSIYNKNYWTPQLLYIQSVYYIKQRSDDTAKKSLQDIIRLFPTSPLAAKARTLIDVLSRRQQIEEYLTNLKIERPADDSTAEPTGIVSTPVRVIPQPQQQPPVAVPANVQPPTPPAIVPPPPTAATEKARKDSIAAALAAASKAKKDSAIAAAAAEKARKDSAAAAIAAINKAKKDSAVAAAAAIAAANKWKKDSIMAVAKADKAKRDSVIAAIAAANKARRDSAAAAATAMAAANKARKDSAIAAAAAEKARKDSATAALAAANKAKRDSANAAAAAEKARRDSAAAAALAKAAPAPPKVLTKVPETPHYVAIVLEKVDPVYVNEARNAFTRYNKDQYGSKGYAVNNQAISDDVKLVLIGPFANAAGAIDYIDKTRQPAATEIVPWLPASKYSFIIVNDNNLEVLKNTKDVPALKQFLQQNYPGKF
jgi:outer membrane protein assembly factor BamD (BamD/ComL family)